jgi:NAD(P) transhydrogenase subunit alpha
VNLTTLMQLYVFVLAGFVGMLVIARVPPLLHTPLMSATNAISGISLVGSLVAPGAGRRIESTILGTVAVSTATIEPTSEMPEMAFVADMSGVCSSGGTLVITMKPTNAASTKM